MESTWAGGARALCTGHLFQRDGDLVATVMQEGSLIGALASITGVCAGLGTVIAGPIVDLLNYHWLFWLPGILVGLAAVGSVIVLPMSSAQRTPGRISWSPVFLMSGWLVCLLVALSQGS